MALVKREVKTTTFSASFSNFFTSFHLLISCFWCTVVVVAVVTDSSEATVVFFFKLPFGDGHKQNCNSSPYQQAATYEGTHHHQTPSEVAPLLQPVPPSELLHILAVNTFPTVLSETGGAVSAGRATFLHLLGYTGSKVSSLALAFQQ